MALWLTIAAAAVIGAYLLGKFFQAPPALETIQIYLDKDLNYQRTVPDVAVRDKGKPVVWEVLIDAVDPRDADVEVEFKGNTSPFKEKKVKSGKGNSFFGRHAKNGGEYKYSIAVEGTVVADPVIRIRE
jgi:hypothetical protein